MKASRLIFILVCLATGLNAKAQTSVPRIEIVQPDCKQEATSIWRTINDIEFFEKQGYNTKLPKNSLIDSLIAKSKNGNFGNNDFPAIYKLVKNDVFNPKDYEKAIQKVRNQIAKITQMICEIDAAKTKWDWKFKTFGTYQVVFTLYGTGGSYNPNEGIITLLTDKDGNFMNYKNPANTIIHEIAHMGMEDSIVRKHKLSHGMKERITDTFVYLLFKDQLPEYKIQNMGDNAIDKELNAQEDLSSLNSIASKFRNR